MESLNTEAGLGGRKTDDAGALPFRPGISSNFDHSTPMLIDGSLDYRTDGFVRPVGDVSLNNHGPFEFLLYPTDQHYLMLGNLSLYCKAKITRPGGLDLLAGDAVAPINGLGFGMWSHIEYCLNDSNHSGPTSSHVNYKTFMETHLSYNSAAHDTHLKSQLFAPDTPGHFETFTLPPAQGAAAAAAGGGENKGFLDPFSAVPTLVLMCSHSGPDGEPRVVVTRRLIKKAVRVPATVVAGQAFGAAGSVVRGRQGRLKPIGQTGRANGMAGTAACDFSMALYHRAGIENPEAKVGSKRYRQAQKGHGEYPEGNPPAQASQISVWQALGNRSATHTVYGRAVFAFAADLAGPHTHPRTLRKHWIAFRPGTAIAHGTRTQPARCPLGRPAADPRLVGPQIRDTAKIEYLAPASHGAPDAKA